MKNLLILLLVFGIAGCANKIKVEDYTSNSLDVLTPIDQPDAQPVAMPTVLPESKPVTQDGKTYVGFTPTGARSLLKLKNAAEANTKLLELSLDSQKSLVQERNAVLTAAKAEQTRANLYAGLYVQAYNDLEVERQQNRIESLLYKALMGVGAVLLFLH